MCDLNKIEYSTIEYRVEEYRVEEYRVEEYRVDWLAGHPHQDKAGLLTHLPLLGGGRG